MITITRFTDIAQLRRLHPPIIFYGRRKTGKTFLVKNYYKDAEYFFVRRDRSVFWENKGEVLNYDEFIRIIETLNKRTIIVDEFQRLPEDFLDYLHVRQFRDIVLITSTLFLVESLISKRSPILGLFLEYRVDTIDERDILLNLSEHFHGRELVERSVFLREPILLQWADLDVFEIIKRLRITVPALIGEVFLEEHRTLTERYEGILRAVSSGKQSIDEITKYLYKMKLIDAQNPSLVKPYVDNLRRMGLLKRYKEFYGNKYYYFVSSPMIDVYFYLDEKYNFSESELDRRYFLEKIPFYVEDFFRSLLAKLFNHRIFVIKRPEFDIDIVLGDFQKLSLLGEVKWKKFVERSEIREIEDRLNAFDVRKRVLIVPEKEVLEHEPKKLEVWDVNDVLSFIRSRVENLKLKKHTIES